MFMTRSFHVFFRLGFVAMAAALLLLSPGCMFAVGAAAGAGGYYFVRGEVVRDYDASLDRVHSAVLSTMHSFEVRGVTSSKDGFKGRYNGRRADDSPVRVRTKRLSDNKTQVRVRIGKVGDRENGMAFHERLKNRL